MKTISKISVNNLYGEYNHQISLPSNEPFAIVYGPNGVGKTKVLELAQAISQSEYNIILRTEFSSATLEFTDGSFLLVKKTNKKNAETIFDDLPLFSTENDDSGQGEEQSITFEFYHDNESKPLVYTPDIDSRIINFIENNLGWVSIGNDYWMDPEDGEIRDTAYLARRYGSSRIVGKRRKDNINPLKDIIDDISIRLIETQRLRNDQVNSLTSPFAPSSRRLQRQVKSRIIELSEQMRELINKAQTENSNTSQKLDRTFASRVLDYVSESSEEEIRDEFRTKEEFRNKLTNIISDGDVIKPINLPENDLKEWQRNFLDLYLKDTSEKLKPFEKLLEKIELLQKTVNSRLNNKTLQADSKKGFKVIKRSKNNLAEKNDVEIPLDSLSSGEQHEIILIFDLLFNTPENCLVLIDEPEISLHVSWQRMFIPDVSEISQNANFKFIVATHSPQIMGEYINIAQRLGNKNFLWDE